MRILDIFITEYCNLSCPYCTSVNNIKSFISLNELKNRDYSKYDTINILGGEPLLHPEIIEILEYFNSKQNKTIILYTNGIMIPKLKLKQYKFSNLNILITFHNVDNLSEIESIYNYVNDNKFYNDVRYQMLYTIKNKALLKIFNNHYLVKNIMLGFDIYLDTDIKHLVFIKRYLNNFNIEAIKLLFQKKEENIVRSTDLILKDTLDKPKTEYHEGFQFCLLKYHFQWDKKDSA